MNENVPEYSHFLTSHLDFLYFYKFASSSKTWRNSLRNKVWDLLVSGLVMKKAKLPTFKFRTLRFAIKMYLANISKMWKSKTRVTVASSDIRVTSSSLRVISSNWRVTSSNPQVTSSNSQVTSSNLRVMSSNLRVRGIKVRVARLKARVERLKTRVRILKALVNHLRRVEVPSLGHHMVYYLLPNRRGG